MLNKEIEAPNVLLIAGQQQNVGKTTLACNIISRFSRNFSIVGLKVSPHFHENTGKATLLLEGDNYSIMEEQALDTNKDTALMLKSGAEKAYLVQSTPEKLVEALQKCLKLIPKESLIVCESAGLRKHLKPGVFLALRQLYCKICSLEDNQMFQQADRIVTFTVNGFDIAMDELNVVNGGWNLISSNNG